MHHLVIPYFIIAILFITFYSKKDQDIFKVAIIFLLVVSILILGLELYSQPLRGDAGRYAMGFERIGELDFSLMNSLSSPEYFFRLIGWISYQISEDANFYFLVLYSVTIVVCFIALKKIYNNFEAYIIFSILIIYPYFLFYVINAKRHGLALVFMLLAIGFLLHGENKKAILSTFIGYLFHKSILLIAPIFVLFIFIKDLKTFYKISLIIFIISILTSFLGLNEKLSLLNNFIELEDRYSAYLDDTLAAVNYRTGFRLDFTIFSLTPILIFYFFKNKIHEEYYANVLKWISLYMLLNSTYHFFSFVVFSDRFAIFSWFILPIVCYEVLKSFNKQYMIIFIYIMLFINIILIQFYTGNILRGINII